VVLAYADREAFVRGLRDELGFSEKRAAYFRRSSAPRPLSGKLLVPPGQSLVNLCHELVHHHLESHTARSHLLEAKWLDEGAASYLAARVMAPASIREQLGWFRLQRSYLPVYRMRSERDWGELHRVPELRRLAYLQAMSLVSHLFATRAAAFAKILARARQAPVEQAFREATGITVAAFVEEWLDRTRADWSSARFDKKAGPGFLQRARPAEVGLDPAAVRRLIEEAARTRSDTLIVVKDGRLVVERRFLDERGPIETMSVTKSFVSLAVGLLVAEGKIKSVDAPMWTWIPEWKADDRSKITLRHVLTHTSGLEHKKAAGVISRQADRTRYAVKRPLVEPPGRRFSYNNEATQLLSLVVEKAAGEPLDRYLERRLFRPLGIRRFRWERDLSGNVIAYYGLALGARDLARVGLLMLEGGKHDGKQLLPASFVRAATTPGLPAFPHMGYLWWLRYEKTSWLQTPARRARLEKAGLAVAPRLRRLDNRRFDRAADYWMEAGALLGRRGRAALRRWLEQGKDPPVARVPSGLIGYNANGWQGQGVAVYPRWKLVVVRQRRPITYTEVENKRYGFWSFFELVERLVKR
jgi:CubicO group peptidase (beta-lactamase class C family)